jgi:hypothetical protein
MKRFSLLWVLTQALCGVAMANIIPTSTLISGTGPYTWTYDLQLSADQNVSTGTAPSSNPVPHTNLTFAGFITIYDFAGYLNGSCAGPVGWTCTAQNIGFTPDDVFPTDNPNIVNITWSHTSGSTFVGPLDLGLFTAESISNKPTQVSYASRGIANTGPQTGTIADNVGNTQGPSGVPEPATVVSFGLGLALLGAIRRKVSPR